MEVECYNFSINKIILVGIKDFTLSLMLIRKERGL